MCLKSHVEHRFRQICLQKMPAPLKALLCSVLVLGLTCLRASAGSFLLSNPDVKLVKVAIWRSTLLKMVCAGEQEDLDSLQRSYGCQEAVSGLSNNAASAKHALQLSNALRRLMLRRVPSLDEELVLQVSVSVSQNHTATSWMLHVHLLGVAHIAFHFRRLHCCRVEIDEVLPEKDNSLVLS